MTNPLVRHSGRPKGAKNKTLPFKSAAVSKAIRGILSVGLSVARIEIETQSGRITITPGAPIGADTDAKLIA
jgi:hypothetical protein